MNDRIRKLRIPTLLVVLLSAISAPSGFCQRPQVSVNSRTGDISIKTMTSSELKEAIASAAAKGDLTESDAKELIQKVSDIEILMEQFKFIRDHERSMIGVMRSSFH